MRSPDLNPVCDLKKTLMNSHNSALKFEKLTEQAVNLPNKLTAYMVHTW